MSEANQLEPNGSQSRGGNMIVSSGQPSRGGLAVPDTITDAPQLSVWPGSHPAAPREFSVSRLLRQKWLMLAVFLLVAGPAIPLVWKFVHPEFKSTATIRVAPVAPRLLYRTENNTMPPAFQSYVNTEVSMIRNTAILERVLDQKDIQETSWYRETPSRLLGSPPTHMERLATGLVVRPRRGTELIDAKMTTKEPK